MPVGVWGLFFENPKGIQHLTEVFKKLSFESEDAAKTKLKSIESERLSEDAAFPFSLEEARSFEEKHDWKFASTYAKTASHE